jgi:hypothetical protein
MPYKLIGHIPCGTEACTTATHSSSECNSVDGNINVDLTPVAKESTLLTESEAIKKAIENLDLSSVESKVEEESQAIQGKIDNIDLTPIENKVDEGVSALSTKIDNIKLPEIDTTELAKQGSNQEATNSKIYEKLQKQLLYNEETGCLTITNANINIE